MESHTVKELLDIPTVRSTKVLSNKGKGMDKESSGTIKQVLSVRLFLNMIFKMDMEKRGGRQDAITRVIIPMG